MADIINASDLDVVADKIQHSIVVVDNLTAQRWMSRNDKNRTIRRSVVNRYRADMRAGRWSFTGDPIRFSSDGRLLDGQHRLTALSGLHDGVILPMLVIRGLPSESQGVMDQGMRRTPGDQLGLQGIKGATHVAASIKQYLLWKEDYLFRDTKAGSAAISTARIVEYAESNPDSVSTIQSLAGVCKKNDAPPSVAGGACLIFSEIDADDAREFFTLLAQGAGVHGHPIVTLDKTLQRIRRGGVRYAPRDYLALLFLAWNKWRDGAQFVAKYQRPRGGAWTPENFPQPH